LLDLAVLATIPPTVVTFMLYELPEPASWREETGGQREERDALEDLGGWTGIQGVYPELVRHKSPQFPKTRERKFRARSAVQAKEI
jgi:hypothetical protein